MAVLHQWINTLPEKLLCGPNWKHLQTTNKIYLKHQFVIDKAGNLAEEGENAAYHNYLLAEQNDS